MTFKLRVYNLLKYLSKDNIIHLISFYAKDSERQFEGEISNFCERITLIKKRTYSLYCRIGYGLRRYSYDSNCSKSLALQQEIDNALTQFSFDVAHIDSTYMAQYHTDVRIPTIIVASDCSSMRLEQYYQKEKNFVRRLSLWFRYGRMRNFEKDYLGKFKKCIMLAEVDKEAIKSILPQIDCDVIPNGINLNYFYYGFQPSGREFNIIFTGIMSYLPNVDAVIYFAREIFPLIMKKVKNCHFSIVGKNPRQDVIDLKKENSHITVTGEVADIREYLKKGQVYVCPLRLGSGIKNKLLEAMAFGIPIVASAFSVQGSIDAIDGKDLMISDEPVDFAEKVITLLNDKALQLRLSHNARALVEKKYSWEGVIKQYEKCYEGVISECQTPLAPVKLP